MKTKYAWDTLMHTSKRKWKCAIRSLQQTSDVYYICTNVN